MKEKQAVQEAFTELSSHYEEAVDGELQAFWGWSYKDFVQELVKRTDIKQDQKILDIATGTSVIPRKILTKKIKGIHITGLDITESMLRQGKKKIGALGFNTSISLSCGDAMTLPFHGQSFDVVVSGLASHHMSIPLMLSEMKRILKPGGVISIIDVGSSPVWEKPIMKGFARAFAFLYFLLKETPTRAWMEAKSITNLRTPEGWERELSILELQGISITKLPSRYRFLPEPLSITCYKGI